MSKILNKLKGGDLRSIGKADEAVQEILKNSELFKDVFEGMSVEDKIIRMRSADVIEKVSAKHPEYLEPFKSELINEISKTEQKEVRWHLAQLFSYIKINKQERNKISNILQFWINTDDSKIVKTFSMQTLAEFAEKDDKLKPKIIDLIKNMMKSGSPAIISRGKKLLGKLEK